MASATCPALGGALKLVYDVALLRGFRRLPLADDDPPPVIVDGDIHA